MRLFLRYQISGSMFFFWLIAFYYGGNADNLTGLINNIPFLDKDYILGVVAAAISLAMPIGTLIHQLSIVIKNWGIAKCFNGFDDFPNKKLISKLNIKSNGSIDTTKQSKYCLDKISNLNSLYYVRFDNGFLAPAIALIVYCFMPHEMPILWNTLIIPIVIAIVIGFITLRYIPRIHREIEEYREILNGL